MRHSRNHDTSLTTPRPSRRSFLANGVLGLTGAALPRLLSAAPDKPAAPRKKLIAWGGIDWYSPEKVQMNIRPIEELPFDGTVLQGFKAKKGGEEVLFDWLSFGRTRFERRELTPTIETLRNIRFRRFTDNWLRFNVTPGDVDWFEDFGTILHNARLWAAVAKETGMKGWLFDVEDYKGHVFNYAKVKFQGEKTFTDYARQVRRRGRELMEVVQEAYPEIALLLALGHSYVNRTANAARRLPELEYGLLPAFLNGLIEGAGPRVRLIDGQEQGYGYLTAEDFYRGYHAARQQGLALVPPELHERYRARVEAGVAVYVNYALALPGVAKGPPGQLTPQDRLRLFEHNIYYALATADEYAWCYGERICWWEPGHPVPLPDGALAAIRAARAKVEQDQPLGFDMAERIAAARAKEQAGPR